MKLTVLIQGTGEVVAAFDHCTKAAYEMRQGETLKYDGTIYAVRSVEHVIAEDRVVIVVQPVGVYGTETGEGSRENEG